MRKRSLLVECLVGSQWELPSPPTGIAHGHASLHHLCSARCVYNHNWSWPATCFYLPLVSTGKFEALHYRMHGAANSVMNSLLAHQRYEIPQRLWKQGCRWQEAQPQRSIIGTSSVFPAEWRSAYFTQTTYIFFIWMASTATFTDRDGHILSRWTSELSEQINKIRSAVQNASHRPNINLSCRSVRKDWPNDPNDVITAFSTR